MAPPVLLTRKGAAIHLQELGCATSVNTLVKMAAFNNSGGGPPFTIYRNGRRNHIRYSKADLDEWAAKKLRRVT